MTQVSFWRTGNIEGHMELIRRQVEKSLADPELRNLAVRIVSHSYDHIETKEGRKPVVLGWDKYFWAPEGPPCDAKDDACELGDLWAFVVRNCRYVYDPDGTDLFATAKVTLLTGGGDCDDAVITFVSLARAIGFTDTRGRVVSMSGEEWEHTYPVIGCPKDNPKVLIPFDPTVAGVVAGWQVPKPSAVKDFPMF
jgi:hypothetical protein